MTNKNVQLVNDRIQFEQVRVIDSDGTQLGIMNTQDALRRAKSQKLDLVLVAEQARPPVCKIVDRGKELYKAKKKANAAKKKQTVVETKEIQLRPVTDKHDLETKLKRAQGFIDKGKRVRFHMKFRGRERTHSHLGMDMMNDILGVLENITVEKEPALNGPTILMIVAPEKQQ